MRMAPAPDARIQCDTCYTDVPLETLNEHIATVHLGYWPYRCLKCPLKWFISGYEAMETHRRVKGHPCRRKYDQNMENALDTMYDRCTGKTSRGGHTVDPVVVKIEDEDDGYEPSVQFIADGDGGRQPTGVASTSGIVNSSDVGLALDENDGNGTFDTHNGDASEFFENSIAETSQAGAGEGRVSGQGPSCRASRAPQRETQGGKKRPQGQGARPPSPFKREPVAAVPAKKKKPVKTSAPPVQKQTNPTGSRTSVLTTPYQYWLKEKYLNVLAEHRGNAAVDPLTEARRLFGALKDKSKWEAMAAENNA